MVAVPARLSLLHLCALREGADSRRANSVGDQVCLLALTFGDRVRVSVYFEVGFAALCFEYMVDLVCICISLYA